MSRLLATIGGILLAAGCRLNSAGLDPSAVAGREAGVRDGPLPGERAALDGPVEAHADRGTSDHAPNDRTTADGTRLDLPGGELPRLDLPPKPDAPKPDAPKPDAPKPDAPKPDAPKPDAPKPDAPKPDAPKPDLPKPDAPKPDLPLSTPACTSGAPTFVFQPNMVICGGPSVTQCNAGAACNASGGWHLCTAVEYLARGGKTILPPAANAWIASCVRSGGAPHAPTNAICASCASTNATSANVAWTCDQMLAFARSDAYVGVGTKDGCRRVGVNQAANEANWTIGSSDSLLSHSTCCK